MAWTTPKTFVSGTVITAAEFNTYLRDNLLMTAPAKATTAGYTFHSTGKNAIAERPVLSSTVNTLQATSSTSFTNLATLGPEVTMTTGTQVLLMHSANAQHSINDTATFTSIAVTGATSITANEIWAIIIDGLDANNSMSCSRLFLFTVTAGSNTFTMKYRVNSGTGTWGDRHLTAMAI